MLKWFVGTILSERQLASLLRYRARIRPLVTSALTDPLQFARQRSVRYCPICGFRGRFWSYGASPRAEAMCPGCTSLERHRLIHLFLGWSGLDLETRRVLHFAPEGFIHDMLNDTSNYVTADISGGRVDIDCDISSMPFHDDMFDTLIANHVLEHVDDDKTALREVRRVIARDGLAILSVPVVPTWKETYEDPSIVSPVERRMHFGQTDHKRYYGRDFTNRLKEAGFSVEIFQVDPRTEVECGLQRGAQLFIARPVPDGQTTAHEAVHGESGRWRAAGAR